MSVPTILDFQEVDNFVTVRLQGTESAAGVLRTSLMYSVSSYAIEYITYDVNTSPLTDENLAHRLGMCVIDNSKYTHSNTEIDFKFKGPLLVRTRDLPQLPFKHDLQIVELREGQEINARLRLTESTGFDHIKWNPVSAPTFDTNEDGTITLTFYNVGIWPTEELLRRGLAGFQATLDLPAEDIYSRPIV